jgi:uncharacterized alkaline shock family protein YloU
MSECPFEIKPFAQSSLIRNEKVFNLNYTNQDFWSLKTRLVEFINERFGDNGTVLPNTFNDLVEGSIAIMLIENWAFIADTLSFKIDQMVNELFIDTVTETDNAFRLCKLVGFKPTPPIPSRSLWTATLNSNLLTDVVIPAPIIIDVVSDDVPISIELFPADSNNRPIFDQDIIIPSGSSVNSAIVGLEGRTFTTIYSGTGLNLQSYVTDKDSVIYDSVTVKVDGQLWEQVEYFTDSQPRKEYRVEFDSSYRAYVIFGNNRAGLNPTKGSRIEITGRTGGGTVGNIVTGYVEAQRQVNVFGIDFNVPVTFRNYTKGDFGYNGDTIEDIRRKLPAFLRSQNRAVTGMDYKIISDQFATPYHGQIGKSVAVLRNHGCAGNVINLYILARAANGKLQEANDDLKKDLADMLEEKKMMTDIICIKNGEVLEVDVSVEVSVSRINRKFEQEIKENIQKKINEFFDLNLWEFDMNLRESDLIKYLSSVKQANSFDIIFTTNDEENSGSLVVTKYYQIIRPDTINISFMYV